MGAYDDLNINDQLISNTSLMNGDSPIANPLPLGEINYSHMTQASKTYTAVVAKTKTQGAFQDIQEALNYTQRQGGGRVLILPGTYLIDQVLTIYPNTKIEGLARETTVFNFNGGTNYLGMTSDAIDITITGLTFLNARGTSGAINVDATLGAKRITIDYCLFGTNAIDVNFVDVRDGIIDYCRSESSDTFVNSLNEGGLSYITHNRVETPISYAFRDNSQAVIADNIIASPGTTPFYGEVNFSVIRGNFFTGSPPKYACEFSSAFLTRITENQFSSGSSSAILGTNMENCAIASNRSGNMIFSGLTSSHIVGNTLSPTSITGTAIIQLGSNSVGNQITGNFVTAESVAVNGVTITGTSSENQIVGNSINGGNNATTYGVQIDAECSQNVVVGNKLFGNTGDTLNNGTFSVIANNI